MENNLDQIHLSIRPTMILHNGQGLLMTPSFPYILTSWELGHLTDANGSMAESVEIWKPESGLILHTALVTEKSPLHLSPS